METFGVTEPNAEATLFRRDLREEWSGVFNIFAIDDCSCVQCEAVRHGLLIRGMNVVGVAYIDRHCHAGVPEEECPPLCIANRRPQIGPVGIEVGDLHE